MSPVTTTIEIARPPDEVFAYVTDPLLFTEWQNDVVAVRWGEGRTHALGARLTTVRRIGGVERSMTQEITEFDPPRRWAARGIDGPVRPVATILVEPVADGGGSRVTFGLDFDAHGIGVPLIALVRRQARKAAPVSYQNAKRRLEAG